MPAQFNEAPKGGLPDLDEFFKKITPTFRKKKSDPLNTAPKKHNILWWVFVAVLLILVLLGFSSVVTVQSDEAMVILRGGVYYKTEGPGMHFTIPLYDERTIINLKQENIVNYSGENLTLDGALVQVSANLAYQVTDPKTYLLTGSDQNALQGALSQAVTDIILQSHFSDLLTNSNWKQVGVNIQNNLTDVSQFGVKVTGVEVQSIQVPDALAGDFNSTIANAETQVKQLIQAANDFAAALQPLAAKKAATSLAYADAEKFATMVSATRDAAEFQSLIPAYQTDSATTIAYLPLLLANGWKNIQAIAAADTKKSTTPGAGANQAAYLRWQGAAQQSQAEAAQNENN